MIAKSRKIVLLICILVILSPTVNTLNIEIGRDTSVLANLEESIDEISKLNDIPNQINLEDYIRNEINYEIEEYDISGVTISVVQDGEMIFTQGYGYKDFGYATPVVAEETLFRIGSISKTFTAVATMQLVEIGLLDLDVDINTYLTAFKIPETFAEPITLRHLLTHTSGFDVSTSAVLYETYEEMLSLEEDLISNVPDRVRPAGELTGYSNYGSSLVGYIVQEIAGTTFFDYIEENITLPLGMNSTTCRQQLPLELQDDMSSAYYDNEYPGFYEYFSLYPAGGFTSTSTDMAKFMMMLLNNGTYNNVTILEENSVQEMFSDQFSVHPDIPAVGLGLYEADYRNAHIIGHGGDTIFFHSNMMLFPDENFGLFISYNSRSGILGMSRFVSGLMKSFYYFDRDVEPLDNYKQRARLFSGMYVSTRRYYSEKNDLDILVWSQYYSLNVSASSGYLQIAGLDDIDFVEIAPYFFVERTGSLDLSLFFKTDGNDKITHMYTNWQTALTTYEKVHTSYVNPNLQMGLLILMGTLSLISLSMWGIDSFFRWKKGKERGKILHAIPKIWTIGFLTTAILTVSLLMKINHETIVLSTETASAFQNLLFLPYLSIAFIVGNIVFTFFAWFGVGNQEKQPYWDLATRIQYTVLTVFSILYIIYPIYWNLFIF
ncbi:MAG: serine hydrolase domain-containing protein [Candidatus Heimdallarchaeaceae archaeon]